MQLNSDNLCYLFCLLVGLVKSNVQRRIRPFSSSILECSLCSLPQDDYTLFIILESVPNTLLLQKKPILRTVSNQSVAVGVKQLEGSLVKRIRHAQQPLERLELREGDETILVHVDDARNELHGLLVVVRWNKEGNGKF